MLHAQLREKISCQALHHLCQLGPGTTSVIPHGQHTQRELIFKSVSTTSLNHSVNIFNDMKLRLFGRLVSSTSQSVLKAKGRISAVVGHVGNNNLFGRNFFHSKRVSCDDFSRFHRLIQICYYNLENDLQPMAC